MTTQQIQALRLLCEGIVDAVAIAGNQGAPAGTLYAAMMGSGCTLDQFNRIMSAIVATGKLRRQGNLYFVTSCEPEPANA